MYSVENPAFPNGMSTLDKALHGPRFTGVGAQILGADDKYICQFTEKSKNFWGSRSFLALSHALFLINDLLIFREGIYFKLKLNFICPSF